MAYINGITKRMLDLVVSTVLLCVLMPILVMVYVSLFLLQGSAVYKHQRIGRGGKQFSCLKFQTMRPMSRGRFAELLEERPDLKREWEETRKLKNDPRVTRLGGILRKTSIDELPQLINVIRGDMSLVGPRPVVSEELTRYGRSSRYYLKVKPGIAGMWQSTGRSSISYRRRVAMDRYYVANAHFITDMRLLFKTALAVFFAKGAF